MGSRKIPEAPYAFPPCLHIKINSRQFSLARGAFDLREMFWFYSPHPSPPTPTPPPTHTDKRNFCLVFNVVCELLYQRSCLSIAEHERKTAWPYLEHMHDIVALPSRCHHFLRNQVDLRVEKVRMNEEKLEGENAEGKIGERKRS